MKKIVVLGSTGSIGIQALDVIRSAPELFCVLALCAGGGNIPRLRAQIEEFRPEYVGVFNETRAAELKDGLFGAKLVAGADAASELAALLDADIVINGISGFAGMRPLLAALKAGKDVALANKESVVCAHALVDEALRLHGGRILPVDSEQSALFQCLAGGKREEVKRLILTASGGPFRAYSKAQLNAVTPEQALKHPTWDMGAKITIDSASLFNKGLEVMEAAYLFGIGGERISVLVHPESIVHSLVEFVDGSNLAQLSKPDMRLAIQYALTYPERRPCAFGALDLAEAGKLTFYAPDEEKFPAIRLAYEALKEGDVLPVVYNGANEAAVELFLRREIAFTEIAERVEYAMEHAPNISAKSVENITQIDLEARRLARIWRE